MLVLVAHEDIAMVGSEDELEVAVVGSEAWGLEGLLRMSPWLC